MAGTVQNTGFLDKKKRGRGTNRQTDKQRRKGATATDRHTNDVVKVEKTKPHPNMFQ